MSYIYKQRKRPQGPQDTEPERTAAPGPDYDALMSGRARPTAAQKGRSFDLDAAMKAKMENAFGDLSAVKFYESRAVADAGAEAIARGNEIAFAPGKTDFTTRAGQERLGHELSHVMSQRSGQVRGSGFLNNAALEARADREGAMAAAGQQVYTGPVTHAISDASPSPSVAGAMQAKRSDKKPKKKPAQMIPSDDLVAPSIPSLEAPRSKYAADFDLLNTQKGSAEERTNAYDHMAVDTMKNLTDPQKNSLKSYIAGSEPINSYLRDDFNNPEYPDDNYVPQVEQEIENVSGGLKNNPLPENISTFKGITDKYLYMMFEQFGLKKALNKDGTVNHAWLRNNQGKMKKKLVGKTFHDKGYTSTTTERDFAQGWAQQKAKNEWVHYLEERKRYDELNQYTDDVAEHPELIKGVHMVRFNLPKGANASFIDRTADSEAFGRNDQREVLVDKGSSFKISDIRKAEDSDTYELIMDMLTEEKGKKRKKK